MIERVTATKTSAEWADLLDEVGVPNAPVQTIDQVREHAQTAALDILRHGGDDKLQFFGLPVSFDGERPQRNEPAPQLGAHDAEVHRKTKSNAAE